jgi:hypothetical protein
MVAAVVAVLFAPSSSTASPYAWSLPEQIPGSSGGSGPLAAVDSQGVVTAVWARAQATAPTFMSASQRAPGGSWTDAAPVGDIEAYPLALDVGRNDVVTLLVWKDSGLFALRLAPGGSWSAPEPVVPAEVQLCTGLHARLDADGPQPMVAWNGGAECSDAPSRVLASVRGDDGSWSAPMTVSAPDFPASLGDLDVMRNGTATFAWVKRPGSDTESSVWLRERRPDGSWTPRQRLSHSGARNPDLSVVEGRFRLPRVRPAMVGWVKYVRPGVYFPHAATREANGKWHYKLLDDKKSNGVTVSAQGEQLAAWTTRSKHGTSLWARGANGFTGLWMRAQLVSPPESWHGAAEFAGTRLFWSGSLSGGGYPMVMERQWLGPEWAETHAISSSHLHGNNFAVAVGAGGLGCVVFGVQDRTTFEYSIQASCLGELA